jgi:hypothetical protein
MSFGDILGLITGNVAANKAIQNLEDIQSDVSTASSDLQGTLTDTATFKPFTVTTGQGTITTDGGLTLSTSPIETGLYGQAQQGLNNLGQTTDVSRLAGQALTGAGAQIGANTGAFASGLGGLYAGLGEQQIAEATDGGLGGLQSAMATRALQAPTGVSQGLTSLQGLAGSAGSISPTADVTGAFGGIQAPQTRTGAGAFGSGLLSQAMEQMGAETPTAQSVYNQIRAMQSPEEERQRTALENRLAAQGRLGVQTSQYGGTPEQLAMEKAQAEARNQASLQALQTADQLASSQQARAAQLGQMGLSAEQIQAQLDSEGFGQQMQLGQAGIAAQQAQSALDSQSQQRAVQLSQLGLSAEQIASQLESEGLNRQQSSAQLAGQLAQIGSGISAQQQQLGQGLLGLGLQAQELGGKLNTQDVARAQSLFGLGQQATTMPYQEEAMQLANIQAQLTAAGIPQAQQLQALAPALQLSGQQTSQQLGLLSALAQLGQAEIAGQVDIGQAMGAIDQERIKAAGQAVSGIASGAGDLVKGITDFFS